MSRENELESAENENVQVLILWVIFSAFMLMTICALSFMLFNWWKEPRPTPQPEIPAVILPTAYLPTAAPPANLFSISFPVILSVSVSEQTWKVTNINSLGYEVDGERYDLATFTRIDGQGTAQGYCINRGWDVPVLGTEYLLKDGSTFVPLQEPEDDPLQRFLKIQ